MGRLFGTDGIRGVAGKDLNAELAMNIGKAAAAVLTEGCRRRPVFVIGTDTRISSDMLSAAVSAGLCSVGADVISLGVVPTPAVAYLVEKYKADAGVMISASHNTSEYNGIKIFSGDGFKLPDALEERIEDAKLRRSSIEMEAITLDNIYKLMLNFGKLYDIISDEEKKSLITYLIKEIQIYPNGESEQPLKSIEFNFPIYRDGQEVRRLLWEKGNTVETVCLLSRKVQ